jgi:hypothetical protein
MIKRALMGAAAVFVVACNSGPLQTADNAVGGATIVSTAQVPMALATSNLTLDWGKKAQAGQVAIADVLTYGGSTPTITAPAGWQLIRDDSTATTRQSLYWHAIQANDPGAPTWTFSQPVAAQGAIILLDNLAATSPIDMTSGNTGSGGTMTAKSIVTTSDGDLVLSFYATDFGHPGLMGSFSQTPANTKAVVNQQAAANEYWILGTYQSQNGATEEQVCSASQIFNWVAAQVAIKRSAGTAS